MSPTLSSPLDNGALARAVRGGDSTLGTFLGTASAVTAEVCAAAGFDWLLLDLEHGAGGEEQVRDVVPAAGSYGVPTVVRVETDARIRMGRVLDNGAAGVMLPRMDSALQVSQALNHTRFPPRGDRGVATYNRACRFGLDPGALDRADDETLVIAQIESAAAVAAVDEIAAVDGVDQLFVGPYDLSLTLGTTVPALLDDDSDASPLTRIVQAATAYGRTVGGFAGTPELAERFRERGISCVAVASDLWITAEGARAALH